MFALAILIWPATGHAAKTDIITIINGDRITGEVMSLSRGKLDYKTDDIGRLSIEWVKVVHLTSVHTFEVEMASGIKYFGRLGAIDQAGTIAVYGVAADTLPIPSVVQMSKIDAGFFQRVQAYLDLGYTFAKANEATTFTSSGEIAYRGTKLGSSLSFSSYAQGQTSTPISTQNSLQLQVTRYLAKRWSANVVAGAEQNDALNLVHRFTGGGGMGRMLHQSNQSELSSGAGLVMTQEEYSPTASGTGVGNDTQTNLEAYVGTAWDAFRFDSPKLDFSTTLQVFPSLSTLGRVRGDFNTRLKYELFTDFNAGIDFTDWFDSRPPEEDASNNDFILSFTVGWTYRR